MVPPYQLYVTKMNGARFEVEPRNEAEANAAFDDLETRADILAADLYRDDGPALVRLRTFNRMTGEDWDTAN